MTGPSVTLVMKEESFSNEASKVFQAASDSSCGRPLASQTMAVGKARAEEKFLTSDWRTISEEAPFIPLSVLWMRSENFQASGVKTRTMASQKRTLAVA